MGYSLQEQAEALISQIQNNTQVATSLKIPVPGAKVMRGIDVRTEPGGPILMKAFVCWDHSKLHWHLFLEGADEKYWEERHGPAE